MKQRIFSLFTALCLCLTLLPTAAFAEGEDNNAPQGDTDSTNYYEIDTINNAEGGDEGTPEEGNTDGDTDGSNNGGIAADGSVSYRYYEDYYYFQWQDGTKGKSEYTAITNENIENIEWSKDCYVVSDTVTINKNVTFSADKVDLILCDGAELTVNGKLGAEKLNIYGQESGTGKLTVINNKFDDDGKRYGMNTKTLIIHGGNISATSGSIEQDNADKTYYNYGMYVFGQMTIYGGTVKTEGGDVNSKNATRTLSTGLYVSASLFVSGGSLTATAGNTINTNGDANSRGILCTGVSVSGDGKVVATAGEATGTNGNAYSYGIYGKVSIFGGSLKATADKATGSSSESYGIYTSKAMTVSGGEVTVQSGEAKNSSGVYCSDALTVSGGKVKLPVGSYIEKELKVEGNVTLADLLPDDGKKYGFKDGSKMV